MKKLLLLLLLLSGTIAGFSQERSFEIKDGKFLYNGNSIQIHSGEMHYARVPKEYWKHRLQMLKAMGLNTVATYVFWNYHHPSPGVWDFETENKNIRDFLLLAQEEGMFVILRPGPYACAEWDLGGYPAWLQNNPNLVLRTNNQPFLDSCSVYINKLADQVRDLQIGHGGPVIMVQVENEFGSYVEQRKDIPIFEHKAYNTAIYNMLEDSGLDVPFFTSDGSWLFQGGAIEGVLPTANGEGNVYNLKNAVNKYHHEEGPYMVAEYYPGWLDHWGESFVRVEKKAVSKQIEEYLKNGIHFNIYMAHGGTNFGFTSGANYSPEHHIQPDITSYDYDAPVSEAGWLTPKYKAIRKLMKKYAGYPIPKIPKRRKVIAGTLQLTKANSAKSMFVEGKLATAERVLSFRKIPGAQHYVMYSIKVEKADSGLMKVFGLADYATVYVDGKFLGELNRQNNVYEIPVKLNEGSVLEFMVENMGRINYGSEIVNNEKGILSQVTIGAVPVKGVWQFRPMAFGEETDYFTKDTLRASLPARYTFNFELNKAGDTFLDMSKWGKGVVYVNGHNIGRYWNVGPQQTLYVPGCWLNPGKNEIVVFDQLNKTIQTKLKMRRKPVLDELNLPKPKRRWLFFRTKSV